VTVTLSALFSSYEHVLLDLDGCVWVGERATAGAPEAVLALRRAGKRVAFVTNDPRHATEELVRRLWAQGFQASVEEVVTVGGALQHLLAERFGGEPAVVIGSPAIHRHVSEAGLRIVNGTDMVGRASVVVVAGHDDFAFGELREATRALRAGATLVGAARDATYPMPDGPRPGSGSILAAVEVAGGTTAATVVGKPEPGLFHTALHRLAGKGVGGGRPPGCRRGGGACGRAGRRPGAERHHGPRDGRHRARAPSRGRRRQPGRACPRPVTPMRRRTHHKHSSHKGYRRLLDRLAAHESVHRVATGRVKPRMGAGRPVAQISKVRRVESGLSITINTEGAVIDAYVVTDRPDEVAEFMREQGWAR